LSGSFLSMLDEALNQSVANAENTARFSLGDGVVEIEVVSDALTRPGRPKGNSKHAKKTPDWQPFMDAWARRAAAYGRAQESAPFLTPTLLKRQEEESSEAASKINRHGIRPTLALVVGDLAHRFLQICDFTGDANNFEAELDDFISRALPREFQSYHSAVESELKDIFRGFFGSTAHAELASSQILGREVPLLMPWDGKIMEGVIDVIYEHRGLLYLADYKTDKIAQNELNRGAERYRQQAEIYTRAAVQSLRRNVAAFKVIFLRLGAAVEAPSPGKQGELFAEERS
jgi:ATP-dependent helicase/nuclease subunit A